MRARRRAAFAQSLILSLLLGDCTRAPVTAASPAGWESGVADRLVFGRDITTGGTVSDSAWHVFLTEVVTPRLPAGFSVVNHEGQWRDPAGVIWREQGYVLEVEYPKGSEPPRALEEIAMEYIRRFHQEAVLRIRGAAEQHMYWGPAAAPRTPGSGR